MALLETTTAKKWVGYAQDVPRIYTLTIANTWAAADTLTLTCNGKNLTVTVGTDVATTDVAAAFNAAFNGAALVNDETRNTTGNLIGEFYLCTASVSGSVVTITGRPGKPLTCTESVVTAGDGDATLASTQSPTGKNWLDNAENWSDGARLSADVAFAILDTDVDILYGMGDFKASSQVDIYASWTGKIGLPAVNRDNASYPFDEYSTTFADVSRTAAGGRVMNIGMGDGAGSSRMRLDFSDEDSCVVTVHKTASGGVGVPAALELRNAKHTSGDFTLTVHAGDVYIEQPTLVSLTVVYNNLSTRHTDALVEVSGGTLKLLDTVGGTSNVYDCTITALNARNGRVTLHGTTAVTTATTWDTTVDDRSTGTVTTMNINAGLTKTGGWDAAQVPAAKTLSNTLQIKAADAIFNDPHGRFNSGNMVILANNVRLPPGVVLAENKTHTLS